LAQQCWQPSPEISPQSVHKVRIESKDGFHLPLPFNGRSPVLNNQSCDEI
jgi:hypothetical protein